MNPNLVEFKADNLTAAFKDTMRRLIATVTIVTSGSPAARSGMTATAVTSLCADPPALLVCVNRTASIHPMLALGSLYCINILGEDHVDLAVAFGGKAKPESRFGVGDWGQDDHGVPFLMDATAVIFCAADRVVDYFTHSIIIGKVYAAHTHPVAQPLLYGNGKFIPMQGAQ